MKALVAFCLVFAPQLADAQVPPVKPGSSAQEILGFHLGMASDAVRKRLEGADSTLAVKAAQQGSVKGLPNSSYVTYIQGGSYSPTTGNERIDFFFSPPPGNSVLLGIRRDVHYGNSNAPAVNELVAALIGKYGAPTLREKRAADYEVLWWAWSRAGQPIPPAGKLGQCDSQAVAVFNNMIGGATSNPQSLENLARGMANLDCSLFITSEIRSKNGVANNLHLKLVDEEILRASVERSAREVRSIMDAQNRKQLDEAQTRKPQL